MVNPPDHLSTLSLNVIKKEKEAKLGQSVRGSQTIPTSVTGQLHMRADL